MIKIALFETGIIIRTSSSIQNIVQPSPDRRFSWLEKTGRMEMNKKKNRETMLYKTASHRSSMMNMRATMQQSLLKIRVLLQI